MSFACPGVPRAVKLSLMPFVLDGLEEHEDPGPDPELTIRITVPEEYAGSVMGLLNYRRGVVTGMEVQPGAAPNAFSQATNSAIIRASLPRSQYGALVEDVVEATLGRGKVDHVSPFRLGNSPHGLYAVSVNAPREEAPVDPDDVVKRSINELTFFSQKLDAIAMPELVRPAVPPDAPPTDELVAWAIRVYFYSALCQFREILRATLLLSNHDLVSAVFPCCRLLLELAAHAYYVKKHVQQHLKAKDLKLSWDFLFEVNLGSRDMRERQKMQGGQPPYPEGPHIAKVMACFNEYFPDGHKEKQATETYSSLSEFCHPNCAAFINHFEWETDIRNMPTVAFGRPSKNLLTLCLPAASMAAVSFLASTAELAEIAREDEKAIAAIINEFFARHEK